MDIKQHMEHDHAELDSLGKDILKSGPGADVGGRDNQFDLYDLQLRRHLAVVEEVLLPPIKKDEAGKQTAEQIKTEHKDIRRRLSSLDRGDKGALDWTEEFRALQTEFGRICERHHQLLDEARRVTAQDGSVDLAEEYQRAKIKRLHGQWSWNKVGIGLGAAAAVAGAAFAARYYKSGRRSSGRSEDDFELRLETDENVRLIASSKVEGTPVLGRNGETLGKIENFMVDKYTGRVAYAVMSFGGTFGYGKSLFPLPWPLLDYDEQKDGYALDITAEEFADAPRFQPDASPEFTPEYRRTILLFYRPQSSGASRTGGRTGSSDSSRSAIGGSGGSGTGSSTAKTGARPASTSAS